MKNKEKTYGLMINRIKQLKEIDKILISTMINNII